MFDSTVLGIGTGVISGSVLAIIISLKLQNADIKQMIINTINDQLRMNSQAEIPLLTELEPGFYMLTAIITVLIASIMCLFGSTIALAFVNKEKSKIARGINTLTATPHKWVPKLAVNILIPLAT